MNIKDHPRNEHITFDSENHKYFVKDEEFYGVTSLISKYTKPFDKKGMSKYIAYRDGTTQEEVLQEWREDRQYGNYVDEVVGHFINTGEITNCPEVEFFIEAMDSQGLEPIASEWIIYDEDIKRASAIDVVCVKNDKIVVVDLKSMKNPIKMSSYKNKKMSVPLNTLPDSKYWKQCLQVGLYKYWIETKYNLPVSEEKYVCRIRPNLYQLIPLQTVEPEIEKLYEYEKGLFSDTVLRNERK